MIYSAVVFRRTASLLVAGAMLIAVADLIGWLLGIDQLKSILPGLATMKINTAICLVACGIALAIVILTPTRIASVRYARTAAVVGILIAGLTLLEYMFHWNLAIDQLFVRDLASSPYPGRMGANTAVAIVLLGSGITIMSDDSEARAVNAQLVAGGSATIALFAIIGYLYNASFLFRLVSLTPMSLNTAIAILALGGALLYAKPNRGYVRIVHSESSAGLVLRALLPAGIILPIAIGWIRLEGQRLGYFDTTFGVTILVLSNVIIFSTLTVVIASQLFRVEAIREHLLAELQGLLASVEARVAQRTRELSEAVNKIAVSEQRLLLALSGSNSAVLDFDLEAKSLFCSPNWYEMMGYGDRHGRLSPEEFINLIHPDDRKSAIKLLVDHFKDSSVEFSTEVRMLHHRGSYHWMLSRGRAVRDTRGRATRMIGSQTDITELKQLQETLRNESIKDDLTGLHNRRYFVEQLSGLVQMANRYGRPLSYCLCDIDEFKAINDRFGHRAGDDVIRAFARALSAETRGGDICARYGGDEFCIIFVETSAAESVACLERVRHRIENEVFFDESGARYSVTASFGVTDLFGRTVSQFMESADIALYKAKQRGRNQISVNAHPQE